MKQSFLRKVTGGVLLLLAGLTQAVMAQQAQTEPLIITEDVNYANEVRVKELIIQGTSEDPTDVIDISLQNNSAIETITVKSGKAKIHFTRDENVTYTLGTISIAKEAELTLSGSPQKLSTQSVNNEGQFSDETGNEGMILGPAGLWIQGITPNADITAPDGTQIKSVSLRYAIKSFYKKVIVETYQEGQWVNYDEIKGGESENENPKLRSTQGNDTEKWTLHSSHTFATAIKGTYRFRIETTKDQCKTIWYSKPYELIASEYEIKDDQLTMGEENSTTILPSLLITAGKEGEEVKEATLENIEIAEHAVGTPSVKIESNAKVNLTLKGTNNLGSIELGKGSTITLKPETAGKDMNEKLSISSVRNGGSFTDETATVSLVKDLENHTMIEFTDTVIYQIDNAISVSLRAVGNSLDGDYLLWGEHTIEKLNSGKWEAVQSKSRLRADTPAENPNRSAEVVINLTTTETGTYRMKVTSTDIEDEAHNATLYFLFEITTLKDKIIVKIIDETTVSIDGTSEEYKNANMLLFASDGNTESPIKVTLNNVRLKEVEGYEEYTSSVVAAKQNYELTLNGDNDLAAFTIEEGATATLKKGDSFKSLNATVYNGGKFIDETGTIQQVVDLDGLNMLSITGYEMTDWNGYSLVAYSDFFFGDYEVSDSELEHLVNGEWKPYHNSVMRSAEGTPEGGASDSHECAYTYTGLEAGQYRIRVYAEKWTEGAEFGEANHAVTLYHHFTITEPEPEPTYYSITLPSVEGATTSPAAGTYWEIEGSSFSFSLTLDPDYDQSQPIVKANGTEVTPDANGTYTVSSIYEDITITIEGITENTPTGNAEVEENDVKVWAADGQLHLSVPSTERVWIYAFNGNLIRSLDEVAGDITVNLNKGSYIIVVGEKRYKVAL
ncbi:hypothetical protein [Parabacteroides distasonis]|uniref:Uncharacterized protein n=1 Tax=Parabacteroides distasonis TaxID=823 RepID=A0A174VQP8_PARDI|nr:hypothetical protein [Parabacteroides distasonis]MDB9025364.1 hypothetical protein [Parabacteroides distasonis]MDB9041763.1 hypothetical protein [Parabacteroides distasonis]MDB9092310.1 hypothetical protein [Parabacteroides distasonis]MDB9160086.1 hypothetical protein [Parabacteroides distasonis]MRY84917.1 hypothetical protein [Parabacteroides distasonis]